MNQDLLTRIQEVLSDCQAESVVTLNVSQQTSITDWMIICTARTNIHMKAIANRLKKGLPDEGKPRLEGDAGSDWLVMDLGSCVVHIMKSEARDFYRLESLWGGTHSNDSSEGCN
jgi:ribosome-associated protein